MSKNNTYSQDHANLMYGLILIAVGAVEPQRTQFYDSLIKCSSDDEDRMKINKEYWLPLVRRLRNEGLIPTTLVISEIAENMVGLPDEEVVETMIFFYEEIRLNFMSKFCREDFLPIPAEVFLPEYTHPKI